MIVLVAPFASPLPDFERLNLFLQSGKTFSIGEIDGDAIRFEIPLPPGKPWRSHGDGRLFVYLAWLDPGGTIIRRIKLFAEDLPPEPEIVRIDGLGADGSPACARARFP